MEAVIYCVFGVVYIAMFFLFFFASNTPVEYAFSGAFLGLALYMFGRCIGELCDIAKKRRAARRAKRIAEAEKRLDETIDILCDVCASKDICPGRYNVICSRVEELKINFRKRGK